MRNYGRFAYDASHVSHPPKLVTQPQIDYIVKLLTQVYSGEEFERYTIAFAKQVKANQVTRARASEMIENLKRLRDSAPAPAPQPTTSQEPVSGLDLRGLRGRYYAVRDEEANKVRFFRVSIPTKADSQWLGWVFVDEQTSDDFHRVGSQQPEQSYKGRYVELLRWVVEHEAEALALYGHEIGNCGVCGRTLTDELSRERGIGPICWEKMGY